MPPPPLNIFLSWVLRFLLLQSLISMKPQLLISQSSVVTWALLFAVFIEFLCVAPSSPKDREPFLSFHFLYLLSILLLIDSCISFHITRFLSFQVVAKVMFDFMWHQSAKVLLTFTNYLMISLLLIGSDDFRLLLPRK